MFILILTLRLVGVCLSQEEPEYVINVESSIYICPDEDSQTLMDTSEIELHRHNESATYLAGTLKLMKTLDNIVLVELLAEKEISGHYELIASHDIPDICAEIENPNSAYINYLRHIGFSGSCPIEPIPQHNIYILDITLNGYDPRTNTYTSKCHFLPYKSMYKVDNFVPDTSHLPITSANAGRYQTTMNFYHISTELEDIEKKFLGCLKIDFVIEPM